jgi:hypothetical protein
VTPCAITAKKGFARGVSFPDSSLGFGSRGDQAGLVAAHPSGSSPALDALRGGQSQGPGMASGRELELGVMRPALALTALATSGIPERVAQAPPDLPGAETSFIVALRAEERS